jgi:hypothetical protein
MADRRRRGQRDDEPRELEPSAGRVPPFDLEAEAAVLSAVTIDPTALDRVTPLLAPSMFYADSHGRIFEACVELAAAGKPVDSVQVATWLRDHDRLAQIGGMEYLMQILNSAPAVANVEAYGATVHAKWRIRQTILAAQRIVAEVLRDRCDPHAAAILRAIEALNRHAGAVDEVYERSRSASAELTKLGKHTPPIDQEHVLAAAIERLHAIGVGLDEHQWQTLRYALEVGGAKDRAVGVLPMALLELLLRLVASSPSPAPLLLASAEHLDDVKACRTAVEAVELRARRARQVAGETRAARAPQQAPPTAPRSWDRLGGLPARLRRAP